MTNLVKERGNNGANRTKSILIGIFVLSFGYLWGGLTVYEQIFPFEKIRHLKNKLTGKHTVNNSLSANPNWKERREQFEIFGRQADVVMIGDSITQGGHWDDIFPNIKVANRGIGGDRTDDVIGRLENIISVKPKKAFIMIGINDLGLGRSVDDIFSDYMKIVTTLENNKIQVYIQSTLECSKSDWVEKLQNVRKLNEKLKTYATDNKITFININDGLTSQEDGLLKEYTHDGIHLLGNGYVVWSKTITPYIISN
jgi:lysophospholipase L1-like esterase